MRAINKNKGEKMSSMGQVDITKALTRDGGRGKETLLVTHDVYLLCARKSFLPCVCAVLLFGLKTNQRNLRTSHKLHLNFVLIDIHTGGEGEQRRWGRRESVSRGRAAAAKATATAFP